MNLRRSIVIISLPLILYVYQCSCKTTSPSDSTPPSDEMESASEGFPGWAIALTCLAVVFILLLLCFIWAYRNSWWCTCFIEACCKGGVEDNIILPMPREGIGSVGSDEELYRHSISGDIILKESLKHHGVEEVHQKKENLTKRVSRLYDDSTIENYAYIEDTEADTAMSVLTDNEFENLISQAEQWHQKCIREVGTDLRDLCFTATRFIAGLFDDNGGMLRMEHMGIRLLIPPGAIKGKVELIYMYIVTDPVNMPPVVDGQARAAPTVFCGPHGMSFLERVVVSYEHCANISNGDTKLLPMFTSSQPNGRMQFKNLEEEDDVLVIKKQGRCSIMISHFTGFSSIATPTSPDRPLEIFMNLVVYSSEPPISSSSTASSSMSSNHMILRLYYVHKTTDAQHMVVCEEESIYGIKRTPLTTWLFKTDTEAISLLEIEHNWEIKNPRITVAAKMLRENNYVTKSYMLSNASSSNGENNVGGCIHVTQPGQSEQFNETLHILAQVNENKTTSSKSMLRTSVLLKQPLRQTLRKLLDPDSLTGDWRMFAHELELDDMIAKLEKDIHRRSPTYELLNMWECMRSRNDAEDWSSLQKIFENIGREDVVTEILKEKSEHVTLS